MSITDEGEYGQKQIKTLELIWGEGFLSPGGAKEVDLVLNKKLIKGLKVLDIGCGCGGAAFHLINNHEASHVTGVDVEKEVIDRANELKLKLNDQSKVTFEVIDPGPLKFEDNTFNVVFSKDTFLHIKDKERLALDLYRILKPGGFLCVSDWMRIDDNPPSKNMEEYIELEGLSMEMCSLQRYSSALDEAGFINIQINDRNLWYLGLAKKELSDLKTIYRKKLNQILGVEDTELTIKTWEKMVEVIEQGEHRPGHFYAEKPL
tara:strand:+ start:213 stop:998 length:786 start_codon:yes stop_codon:yes gene_type:complete